MESKAEFTPSNVAPFPSSRQKPRAGLVLTGGGARAAYQVGVVKAVRDILGNPTRNPFPILCGTSAGAINAATLAIHADDFTRPRVHDDRAPDRRRISSETPLPVPVADHHRRREPQRTRSRPRGGNLVCGQKPPAGRGRDT